MKKIIRILFRRALRKAGFEAIPERDFRCAVEAFRDMQDFIDHSGHLTRAYHAGKRVRRYAKRAEVFLAGGSPVKRVARILFKFSTVRGNPLRCEVELNFVGESGDYEGSGNVIGRDVSFIGAWNRALQEATDYFSKEAGADFEYRPRNKL